MTSPQDETLNDISLIKKVQIIKPDKNNFIGAMLTFSLMALYLLILVIYTVQSNITPSQSNITPSTEGKGIKEIWSMFGDVPGKQLTIYLIILITLIYTIYTLFLVGTVRYTKNLTSPRFWEETLIFAFTFSFGLSIPGYYLNREHNYGFILFIFIFTVIFNIVWEMSGFYNYLYPYNPENLNCELKNDVVNLIECHDKYSEQPQPNTQKIYSYLFLFLLVSFLILTIIPSIISPNISAEKFRKNEPFYFIDTFYLGLVNGVMVLLGIQYTNVRRGNELLPSYESSVIILKFIIFHLASRFGGFL
jgi:hypothetical protein